MAHEIEFRGGIPQMAFAGKECWHGLGRKVPGDLTPQQMLEAAGLDWEVRMVKAYAEVAGKNVDIGHSALVRSGDDKILDVVSNDWNPVQNSEAFDFFNDFISEGSMSMETAGSLKGGQIVWALAKINDGFDIFGGDQTIPYLHFTNFHKYGFSTDVRLTTTRVVCNNTLQISLGQKTSKMVKISHRRKFDGENAKLVLGVAADKLQKYKEMAQFIGSKRYTADSMIEYFNTIFPSTGKKEVSRNARNVMATVETQPGAKFAEGSFWQLMNAVTRAVDHDMGRSSDTRLASAWYGPNKDVKIHAMELALEMAGAA